MRVAILIVGHSQTEEWEVSASFFNKFPKDSVLKNSDVLAYVNCRDVSAARIESYLSNFPQPNKFLHYTPLNGHSVTNIPLDVKTNVYKTDYNFNRQGYLFGILEAYSSTFDMLKGYDYVLQVNPDVYVTRHDSLEDYMTRNFENRTVFHVNTMRSDIDKGFSCDSVIYRPNLMADNFFSLYRHPQILGEVMKKRETDPNYKFLPEQILKHIIIATSNTYSVMSPGTRNNRLVDSFGLWHCHDVDAAKTFLRNKQ
jgi:hypothetical protein